MIRYFAFFLSLFYGVIGFSQAERHIEVIVSDTTKLKALNYTYVITSGMSNSDALVEYLGDGEEVVEPDKSMFEFATLLKKEQFNFVLEGSYTAPLSFSNSDSAIVVSVKNENELMRLKEFVDEETYFKGAVSETFYESISLYDEKIYKNLYEKAAKKARLIASYSGGSIGKLISASENTSESNTMSNWYQQLMELGALGRMGQNNSDFKIEVATMVFRFELK